MSLLETKLLGMPFGIAALDELLKTGLLEPDAVYRRREIVDALRSRFIELGGSATTTPQQVVVPLKRVLSGPPFERVRSGLYRCPGSSPRAAIEVRDGEPALLGVFAEGETDESWPNELVQAPKAATIMEILRSRGRRLAADRIRYLDQLAEEDPEEQPIDLESLRHMAFFLLENRQLSDPEVGSSPNGSAQVERTLPDRPDISRDRTGSGLLAMEFLPSGLIRFAALSAPYSPGVDRLDVHGTLSATEAMDAVRLFTAGVTVR